MLRTSDDVEMTSDFSTIFTSTTTAFTLDLTHDSTVFQKRRDLLTTLGTEFYMRRTLTGVSNSDVVITDDFPFTLSYEDACQTATIIEQTITFPTVVWYIDFTSTLSVPAFTDTVDGATDLPGTGTYPTGVCGEKVVTLDPNILFMSSTADATDPVLNNFVIDYDQNAGATVDDVILHTISYTVSSLEYGGHIPDLASSFEFEIICPEKIISSTLVQPMETIAEYDVASGQTLSLVTPLVSLHPLPCFTVEKFKVYDAATDEEVTDYVTVSGTPTEGTIEILTDDRSLVGMQNLYVMTVVLESKEEVER